MKEKILILGAGPISAEYYKIFSSMGLDPVVVGRGEKSAAQFQQLVPGANILLGGLEANRSALQGVNRAVVAVSEDQLHIPCHILIESGVKNILVEKPGAATFEDLVALKSAADRHQAHVSIAYNRRSYSSVRELKKRIAEDGGVKSFTFDFSERAYVIEPLEKNPGVKENWFWHNSSHVVDLAFYLGGRPKRMHSEAAGRLSWHPAGAVFVGSGVSESGALFSYHANWSGPGRWGLEFVTDKNKYFLRPIEKLQVQKLGSMAVEDVVLDDKMDQEFKPGFKLQCERFMSGSGEGLVALNEQTEMIPSYQQILGL